MSLTPGEALTSKIKADAARLGVSLDEYDPDALLSTVFGFLEEHDMVLTAKGLARVDDLCGPAGGDWL